MTCSTPIREIILYFESNDGSDEVDSLMRDVSTMDVNRFANASNSTNKSKNTVATAACFKANIFLPKLKTLDSLRRSLINMIVHALLSLYLVQTNAFADRLSSMVGQSRNNSYTALVQELNATLETMHKLNNPQPKIEFNIDISIPEQVEKEIERLINLPKSEEKVQKLLRLEGMIECEIERLNMSAFRYSGKYKRNLEKLKDLLKTIQNHFDDSMWNDIYFQQAFDIWKMRKCDSL